MPSTIAIPFIKPVKLRLNDLRELFDAVAKDQGKLCDEDLPDSPQALRKAVQRAMKSQSLAAWDIFPKKCVP